MMIEVRPGKGNQILSPQIERRFVRIGKNLKQGKVTSALDNSTSRPR
jgi:hypothetical protein